MKTDLKTKKSKLKNHLINQYGDEILNQKFEVYQYTTFSDLDKLYNSQFNVRTKYEPFFGTDDSEPYYSIKTLNIDEMIEIYLMDLDFVPSVIVLNQIQLVFEINEELTEYIGKIKH